jgi:hypothetical protein
MNKITLLCRRENKIFPVNKKRSLIIDCSMSPLSKKTSGDTETGKKSDTKISLLNLDEKNNVAVFSLMNEQNSEIQNNKSNEIYRDSLFKECSYSYSECGAINNSIPNQIE